MRGDLDWRTLHPMPNCHTDCPQHCLQVRLSTWETSRAAASGSACSLRRATSATNGWCVSQRTVVHRRASHRDLDLARSAISMRDLLRLQHHVRRKVLQLVKTAGSGNPADVGTKDLAEKDMKRIMVKIGFQERTGRHPKSLCISGGAGSPAPTEEGEGLSQLTARS